MKPKESTPILCGTDFSGNAQQAPNVVCIGSHTRPGFTAKVLGSVSLAVLQTSRRPVLIVWPPAE